MFQSTYLRSARVGLLGLALACFGFNARLYGGNIVVDGDFEAADPNASPGATRPFTLGQSIDGGHWIVTLGTVGVDTQNPFVYAGNKSVLLDGDCVGPDSLTQTLPTKVGQIYTVSFWANADTANSFSVTLGDIKVTGAPTSIAQEWISQYDLAGQ